MSGFASSTGDIWDYGNKEHMGIREHGNWSKLLILKVVDAAYVVPIDDF